MAYEMKVGQGSAFKNEKKVQDWHPDFKGKVKLFDGSEHWLEVTIKTTAAGKQYVAVKIGNVVMPRANEHVIAKGNGFISEANDIPF